MVRGLTAFRRAFIAASLAWVVALPLATYAAAQPHASPATYLFALAVYLIGRAVCHQIAERSFELWRHQMPVCARCTGIYLGAALVAVAASFRATAVARRLKTMLPQRFHAAEGLPGPPKRTREGVSPAVASLLLAALPTAATLAFEWTTGVMPSNTIRLAAGLPLGAAVAWTIMKGLENQVN